MQKSQLKEFGGDSNIENGLVDTVRKERRQDEQVALRQIHPSKDNW